MADAPDPSRAPHRPGATGATDATGVHAMHVVLDDLVDVVESARSMPMSASCVVNRAEVLELLDDLRARLPEALDQAQEVLGDRTAVVEDGQRAAEALLAQAHEERRRLLSQTEVVREAEAHAAELLADSRAQADSMRSEVEDYVDAKLANFEVVLSRTLEAVARGRQKLSGRTELDELDGR